MHGAHGGAPEDKRNSDYQAPARAKILLRVPRNRHKRHAAKGDARMPARLGNVLYWIGCILAVPIIGLAVLYWVAEGHAQTGGTVFTVVIGIVGVIVWLIGRACRYVLSGNSRHRVKTGSNDLGPSK